MKKWFKNVKITFGLGIIVGIIVVLIAISIGAYTIYGRTVDNYKDEVQTTKNFLEKTKDPFLQMDYIFAGLTLSKDFQNYLQEGLEKGWWAQDYLNQVVLDEVLPIYGMQYGGTIKALLHTDKALKIKDKLEDAGITIGEIKAKIANIPFDVIISKIQNLPVEQLQNLVYKILSLNFSKAVILIGTIKDAMSRVPIINTIVHNIKKLFADEDISTIIQLIKNGDIKAEIINQIQNSGQYHNLINMINYINSITGEDLTNKIIEIIKNNDSFQDLMDKLEALKEHLIDVYGSLENALDHFQSLLEDVDDDYHFTEGYGPLSPKLLNALDIEIDLSTTIYDNKQTAVNLSDDTLTIKDIYIGFENGTGKGLDLIVGSIKVVGNSALIIYNMIPTINDFI